MSNAIHHSHLIVFGRYPVVGATKTRLIPSLGPVGAAALQQRLTEKTVAAARRAAAGQAVQLVFCHEGGEARQIERWLGFSERDCVPQAGNDLGQRMLRAIQSAFDQGAGRVVLVGTDIPGLEAATLQAAFDRLTDHDLVLGPSTDGGYWLVGMSRRKDIFRGVAWSTPDVLTNTLALARRKGMNPCLLEALTDIDTPEDLARMTVGRPATAPYLSVIIPTLNEAPRIGGTIAAAACPDAQIIVADGGSKDRTATLARAHGAHVIHAKRGRAGQQNRAAAAAQGHVVLFLHGDTRLPHHYAAHVFHTLMDRRTVLGAFRFATDIRSPAMQWIAFWTNLRSRWLQLPYGDQGLFMRRTDFWKQGGFPEVPIAEDLYLVRRMRRTGRIALAPATAVTSGRRWKKVGPLRTTLINTVIAGGCLAGVPPARLAGLYRLPAGRR